MTYLSRIRVALFSALVGGMLLGAGSVAAADYTVDITDEGIDPPTVTIAIGDTVTWTNQTDSSVEMELSDGSMTLAMIAAGESATITFVAAGTLAYQSTTDPDVSGTVIVEESAGETDAPTTAPSDNGSQPPTDTDGVAGISGVAPGGINPALPLMLLVAALFSLSVTLRRRATHRA
ncbi:hypothetical protein BH20CHL6_BH20CHL6_19820 [soil metagenome]